MCTSRHQHKCMIWDSLSTLPTSTMSHQSATTTSDSSKHCIRASLSVRSLVRALVHSGLDYCNGVLANAPIGLYNKLQSVMRAAARLVLRLPSRASISLATRNRLHWLPFPQRVTLKLCMMAYKSQHGLLPPYLNRMCTGTGTVPARGL